MNLLFDGWYNELQEEISHLDTDKTKYTDSLFAFIDVTPKDPTQQKRDLLFTSVRVYVFLNTERTSIQKIEYVAWHEGEEVQETKVPIEVKDKITLLLQDYPIPMLKAE